MTIGHFSSIESDARPNNLCLKADLTKLVCSMHYIGWKDGNVSNLSSKIITMALLFLRFLCDVFVIANFVVKQFIGLKEREEK